MTKRFSAQINSDSATPNPLPNNGIANADTGFQAQASDQKTRFSDRPPLLSPGKSEHQIEPLKLPRPQQPGWWLRARVTAIAIAVGMLPVLAVGTATYYFGSQAITEQTNRYRRSGTIGLAEAELLQQRQLQLLATLSLGTGVTALLTGAIAAVWSYRSWRTAMATAARATARAAGQDRSVRTKLFTDAVYQIRASLNREDILKAAVEESRKAIAADRVLVYSLDQNLEGVIIAESVAPGWPKALRATIKDPCFGARYIEKYQNGRVHAVDDIYAANLTPCYLEQLEPFAVRANLVAPLLNEEKLIGLLIAHQCAGPRVWQQVEIDLFTQIATQVGFALDNAKLLTERASLQEQVNSEAQWQDFFADATQHIHASLSEEDVLKAAVEEARRVLAADRVLIYSVARQSQGVVIAESVAPGWPRALGRTIADPCLAVKYIEKYENGRVRAFNNIYEAGMTQCYIEQLETLGVKANLVAPVLREGKLLGLLVAHQCKGPRVWQPVEIRWFTQIAAQVGFALDNVKLISRVEQMAQAAAALTCERQQEKAALQQQISALVQEIETACEAFSTQAALQTEVAINAFDQIQAIADTACSMVANTQKVELLLQEIGQVVQAEHETVNQTVDSIAAVEETVADATPKLKYIEQRTQTLWQYVSLVEDSVAQMNRQAINAAIAAGRNGEAVQQPVVSIAEAVRSFTQPLTQATTKIKPLVVELETETFTSATAMETSKEQAIVGMGLTNEIRQQLDQLTTITAKLYALLRNMTKAATDQAEASTSATHTILEVSNLANHTAAQSAAVAESLTKLTVFSQKL